MYKRDEMASNAKGCFAKADMDEMLFILRAQDATSPLIIMEWIKLNFNTCPDDKLMEAFKCAIEMKNYPKRKSAD